MSVRSASYHKPLLTKLKGSNSLKCSELIACEVITKSLNLTHLDVYIVFLMIDFRSNTNYPQLPHKLFCKCIHGVCLVTAAFPPQCVFWNWIFAASNRVAGWMPLIWFIQLFKTTLKLALNQHMCDSFFLSVGVTVNCPTLPHFLAPRPARLRSNQSSETITGKQGAYPWHIWNYASNWHSCNCL